MLVLSWLLKADLQQLGEACEIGAAMDMSCVYVSYRKKKKKRKKEKQRPFTLWMSLH